MRALVVVPTFEEAVNVPTLLRRIREVVPGIDVLVVDDGGSDGTAEVAESIGSEVGGVTVLRRAVRDGLGGAYRDGFAWGRQRGYDILVSMDADLSHDPAALPSLLAAATHGADIVIGSRYVPGGDIPDWPRYRRALSRYGNRYATALLRLPVRDATSGYRAYRADVLGEIYRVPLQTNGYGALIEMAQRAARSGYQFAEVAITFRDRARGHSKMSWRIALESLYRVTRIGLAQRWGRRRSLATSPS